MWFVEKRLIGWNIDDGAVVSQVLLIGDLWRVYGTSAMWKYSRRDLNGEQSYWQHQLPRNSFTSSSFSQRLLFELVRSIDVGFWC